MGLQRSCVVFGNRVLPLFFLFFILSLLSFTFFCLSTMLDVLDSRVIDDGVRPYDIVYSGLRALFPISRLFRVHLISQALPVSYEPSS